MVFERTFHPLMWLGMAKVQQRRIARSNPALPTCYLFTWYEYVMAEKMVSEFFLGVMDSCFVVFDNMTNHRRISNFIKTYCCWKSASSQTNKKSVTYKGFSNLSL
jgi:hypothetical protein